MLLVYIVVYYNDFIQIYYLFKGFNNYYCYYSYPVYPCLHLLLLLRVLLQINRYRVCMLLDIVIFMILCIIL